MAYWAATMEPLASTLSSILSVSYTHLGFKSHDSERREDQAQIELGKKARKAWLLAALAAGALATFDILATDNALHRHHRRTMYLLGGTRRRLCRSGFNRP